MQRKLSIFLLAPALTLLAGCGGSSGGGVVVAPPVDPPPAGIPEVTIQPVFEQLSFVNPVALKQAPGDSSRWFVVERSGVVRVFDNDPGTSSSRVFVDLSDRVESGGETGLLGLAFHPSFPGTPEAYLSYTALSGNQLISRISRFSTGDGGVTLNRATEEILLTVLQPQGNHNGGDLAFGQDGFLYASFGDGGGGGDPGENAQDTANLLGTVLRIDIDGNSPYEIPLDNPFASANLCAQGFSSGEPCPEIYAYGFRNPWRISIDSATGDLWIGDVGQNAWEEIDRVAVGQSALERNYGWDDREGAHPFETISGCATTTCIDPVTEYDHSVGGSITGGYVYRGNAIPDLEGWYVFGDFSSGRLFAVPADSQPTVQPEELLDSPLLISAFAEDLDGDLYLLAFGGVGTIHKVTAAP